MIATQRSDGQFVDVKTDEYTVSFKRPTLEQFQAMQDLVAKGKYASASIRLSLACADRKEDAQRLFDEWPGATATVAGALIEMVTPVLKSGQVTKA